MSSEENKIRKNVPGRDHNVFCCIFFVCHPIRRPSSCIICAIGRSASRPVGSVGQRDVVFIVNRYVHSIRYTVAWWHREHDEQTAFGARVRRLVSAWCGQQQQQHTDADQREQKMKANNAWSSPLHRSFVVMNFSCALHIGYVAFVCVHCRALHRKVIHMFNVHTICRCVVCCVSSVVVLLNNSTVELLFSFSSVWLHQTKNRQQTCGQYTFIRSKQPTNNEQRTTIKTTHIYIYKVVVRFRTAPIFHYGMMRNSAGAMDMFQHWQQPPATTTAALIVFLFANNNKNVINKFQLPLKQAAYIFFGTVVGLWRVVASVCRLSYLHNNNNNLRWFELHHRTPARAHRW